MVLDLQATQNPAHAHRGIGRYVKDHARALVRLGLVEALVLNPHLPFPRGLDQDLACSPLLRWNTMSEIRAVAAAGTGAPLAYHLMSPFELDAHAEGEVPAHLMSDDIALVVTLYDLIPLVDPDRYAGDAERMRRYRVRAELVAGADRVLAISEHTARMAVEHLGIDPARVHHIGAGLSPFFRLPAPGDDPEARLRRDLPEIDRPVVLSVVGGDPRKNTERLLEAWARLPPGLRQGHRLVLACHVDDETRRQWVAQGRASGLDDGEVLITGWVGDEVLRALYQTARLFVLASLSEGFGLPAAEAIACGCPAITSSTSSLPEVLGWPAGTFDPTDVDDMAGTIERGLVDEAYRHDLLERGQERSSALTWETVAGRTERALAGLGPPAAARRAPARLRLALVGPMPPTASGIADYNARLLPHLAARCDLDVFSTLPRPADLPAPGVRWFPPLALSRNLSPWSYDAVVYTIGNSEDHHDLYEQAEEFPGLLWMHDVRLPGLYLTYGRDRLEADQARQFLRSRLSDQYRRRLPHGLDLDVSDQPIDYIEAGLGMSQELVERHRGIIVSSQVAGRLLRLDQQPDAPNTPTWVLPLAVPDPIAPVADGTARLVVSFGVVAPVKAPEVLVRSFAAGPARLDSARLVFVGSISDAVRGDLERRATECGIGDGAVHFTGACERADYDAWMARASLAVQLRRATNGESSGAVQECIANSVPVITNMASAADLPPGVVEVVPHDIETDALAARMVHTLTNPDHAAHQRAAQGAYAAAWGYAQVADRLLEIVTQL